MALFVLRVLNAYLGSCALVSRHDAGVCCVQVAPLSLNQPDLLASGSYDENLRVWDLRNMRNPLSEWHLGGGVWRLQWNPSVMDSKGWQILCCCMHNGFQAVTEGQEAPTLVYHGPHTSLAYGGDWFRHSPGSQRASCCSFYDCKLSCVQWSA